MSGDLIGGLPLAPRERAPIPLRDRTRGPIEVKRRAGGRLKGPEDGQSDAARLRKVAEDFEAVFLYQVVKQMRKTVQQEKLFHGGMGEDVFTEMMDEELAKQMAGRGSTGIADLLYTQLSRQHGIQEPGGDGRTLPNASSAARALRTQLRGVQARMRAADAAAAAPAPDMTSRR